MIDPKEVKSQLFYLANSMIEIAKRSDDEEIARRALEIKQQLVIFLSELATKELPDDRKTINASNE